MSGSIPRVRCTLSCAPSQRDSTHGALVIGSKRFHVLPPEAADLLDVCKQPPHTNTSQIPASVSSILSEPSSSEESDDSLERYRAALRKAFGLPGASEAVLGPGTSLLVPEGWWHSAEGETTGVGINAWFR
jgi:lysine-specific demethylase 8